MTHRGPQPPADPAGGCMPPSPGPSSCPSHSCSGLASDPIKIRTLTRPHIPLREGGRLSVRIETGCLLESEPQINTKYPFTIFSMQY